MSPNKSKTDEKQQQGFSQGDLEEIRQGGRCLEHTERENWLFCH